jgi:hypothetical protein
MGIKISAMTADDSIGGAEIIPVSDAGAPKSVTTAGIKNYVIDAIEAITAGTAALTGSDSMFVMVGGVMQPVDIDLVSDYVRSIIWGKADDASPTGSDKIAIIDAAGTTENTVTLTSLSALVLATIRAATLNAATLDAHDTLIAADKFMVTSGTTGKYCTFEVLSDAIYASLATYVSDLNAVTSVGDTDIFYCVVGSVEKKITGASLKAAMGSTIAPATTTENYIPQWDSAQKTLKDGLVLRSTIRESGTADDVSVPTENAVVEAVAASVTRTGGDESGVVVTRLGATTTEGLETVAVDITVTLGAVAGVAIYTVPANNVIRSVQGNLQTAATAGGTTAAVGVGVDADQDAYGLSAALTLDSKINKLLTPTVSADSIALEAFPVTGVGAIGDTAFTAGTLRVRIVYDRLASLNNAS